MNPNTNEKSNKIEICDVIVRYINEEFRKAYEKMKSCYLHEIDIYNKSAKTIINNIDRKDNVYCIFCENKELLYVGKSVNDIKGRLKEHLISKSKGTEAKYEKSIDYVLGYNKRCEKCKYKCNNSQKTTSKIVRKLAIKKIFLGTLCVDPWEYAQLAETYYINHYKPRWNRRKK